jgi:hypothetical protein
MAVVKREMDKPSFSYNADPNSAWALYNHITLSLKDSHPMTFLSDHEDVHKFFVDEFGQLVANPIVTPAPESPLHMEKVFQKRYLLYLLLVMKVYYLCNIIEACLIARLYLIKIEWNY